MIKTDMQLASALLRLEGDSSFQTVKEWLQASFKKQLTDNISLEAPYDKRYQGYAEALQDILGIMEDPRKLAEKFKQ